MRKVWKRGLCAVLSLLTYLLYKRLSPLLHVRVR